MSTSRSYRGVVRSATGRLERVDVHFFVIVIGDGGGGGEQFSPQFSSGGVS
jgi:hypothetical protein